MHISNKLFLLYLLLWGLLPLAAIHSWAQVTVSLPIAEEGRVDDTILLPIAVSDLTGLDVTAYQFTLTYDASILEVVDISTDGTLSAAAPLVYNVGTPGQLAVAFAHTSPLEGTGPLLQVQAQVIGSGTAIISFSEFILFDSQAQPVASSTAPGYFRALGVEVTLPEIMGMTGEALTLPIEIDNLTGLEVNAYQFTLHYDPSVLILNGVSTDGTLSESASLAVNTSQTGQLIVAAAQGIPFAGAGILLNLSGIWVDSDTTHQPFFAAFTLFNTGGEEVASSPQGLEARLPLISGTTGEALTVSIETDNLTGLDVNAYQFTLHYDPAVLTLDGVSAEGTLSESATLVINTSQPGQLTVAAAQGTPFEGAGILLNLSGTWINSGMAEPTFSTFILYNSEGNQVPSHTSSGNVITTGLEEDLSDIPVGAPLLLSNYPNPFQETTTIPYMLSVPSHVRIEVYDLLGRLVDVAIDANQPKGRHTVIFEAGSRPSGIYFYRIMTDAASQTMGMTLLR